VVGLLWGIEDLLDVLVITGVAPGFEEAADRVEIEHPLQGDGDLRPHHMCQGQIEDRVSGGHWASLPVFLISPASFAGKMAAHLPRGPKLNLVIGKVNSRALN
jgi:hypothetical protein